MRKTLIIGALAFVLGGGAVFIYLKHSAHSNSYATMHEMHHGKSGGASQGMMQGHMHDEMTMPGLQGKDTTETEVADLRKIFQQHMEIERRVTNLPDGISTFTASENPEVRAAIVSHVSMMVTRLAEGKNPEVIIQSPHSRCAFLTHEDIENRDRSHRHRRDRHPNLQQSRGCKAIANPCRRSERYVRKRHGRGA